MRISFNPCMPKQISKNYKSNINFNFNANVNPRFRLAAKRYYEDEAQKRFSMQAENLPLSKTAKQEWIKNHSDEFVQKNMDAFDAQVDAFKLMGKPDTEIRYSSHIKIYDPSTKTTCEKQALIIHDEGQYDVALTSKTSLWRLLERFFAIGQNMQYKKDEVSYIAERKRSKLEALLDQNTESFKETMII